MSLQDIRHHIKGVKNIQQITNAMDMVATSRLRHAKEAAIANRPYAEKVKEAVMDVAAHASGDLTHPLLQQHETGKRLILCIAADKGLAGAYSSNACKKALTLIEDKNNTTFITVGRKARDYFHFRGYNLTDSFFGISEKPGVEDARMVATALIDQFIDHDIKEVYMVYTHFVSAINCEPRAVQLLPFVNLGKQDGDKADKKPQAEFIYEPSADEVLRFLLPQYLFTTIYAAMLQSAASELSSRMNAMSNATDNAEDLMNKLNLHYNKVRQAGITREITEIVGGAEALK